MAGLIHSAVMAVALLAPMTAGATSAADEVRRTAFLPAAATTSPGEWNLTLYELGLPSLAYGVTDSLQVGIAGTHIPTADTLLAPGAKLRLARAGEFHLSAFGTLGVDVPASGRTGFLPLGGLVLTRYGMMEERLAASAVIFLAAPASPKGVDHALNTAASAAFRVSPRFYLLGELHLHSVVPELQMGITSVLAGRLQFRHIALDAGWMLDYGIVGPDLPVLGFPGVPVVNLSLAFP